MSTRRNVSLLYGFKALQMSLLPVSILTLFYKFQIGMTMTEILAVQGAFGFVVALFEFPSGYIADRVGYKKTLVVSSAIAILGWTVYGFADSLVLVIVSESLLGVSISLASGCDSAMLYESLRDDNREHHFARFLGRLRFWGQSGEGTAALLAGVIYAYHPQLPFFIQAGISAIAVVLTLALVEPSRAAPETTAHWQHVKAMVKHALRDNKPLASIILVTIVLGLASFVPVWLVPLHAKANGLDETWIGPMWAVANYNVAIASLFSARLSLRLGLVTLVVFCLLLIAIGFAGLALTAGLFGFAWYYCLTTMRGFFGPALSHEENKLIPSSDRAGYLSLRSLLFRVSFLLMSPFIGLLFDHRGSAESFAWIGGFLSLIGMVSLVVLIRHWRGGTRTAPLDLRSP